MHLVGNCDVCGVEHGEFGAQMRCYRECIKTLKSECANLRHDNGTQQNPRSATMTPQELLRRLDEDAATGLDLSPGNPLAAEAAELIRRLLAGRFTKEEINDICHNLHNTVNAAEFAEGCAAEQRRVYGCAPDADRYERLRMRVMAMESASDAFKLKLDVKKGILK